MQPSFNSVVVAAPLRASFVGGGTDLPEYYGRHGGLSVGCGIRLYNILHVISNASGISTSWRLCATRAQAPSAEHGGTAIIEAALAAHGLAESCSAVTCSDLVQLGSGLGSSSSLAVAAAMAAAQQLNHLLTKAAAAEEGFRIERRLVGAPVGKQDHYMSAFGGFHVFEFKASGEVIASPIPIGDRRIGDFEAWLSIVRVPRVRSANAILSDHGLRLRSSSRTIEAQHAIKKMVDPFVSAVSAGSFALVAEILDRAWQEKRRLTEAVSNNGVDALYRRALDAGALGGKLLGAGGGGHMLLMTPPERFDRMRAALAGFDVLRVQFDQAGARVLHAS